MSGDDLTIVLFIIGTAISIAIAAMHAAGWKHPILIRGLFVFAVLLGIVGVLWPSIKAISPSLTEAINKIATSPIAWFVLLILGLIASLTFPTRARTNEKTSIENTPEKKRPKIFLDATQKFLTDFYTERTSAQADALTSAYIGQWMRVTGRVRDVSIIDSSRQLLLAQIMDNDGRYFSLIFENEIEKEKIRNLPYDTQVTVAGEISRINNMVVTLSLCELVNPS